MAASVGACGIYCQQCPVFTLRENRCFGCGWLNGKLRQFTKGHKGCSFWECAQARGLESCFLCGEFPCQLHYGKEGVYTEQSLETWKKLMRTGRVFPER
jgi:hypothetical protein